MTRTTNICLRILYVGALVALPELVTRVYFATVIGPRVLWYGTGHFHRENIDGTNADEDLENHRSGRDVFLKLQSALNEQTVELHGRGREGFDTFHPHEIRYHWDIDTRETFNVSINGWGYRGNEFVVVKPPRTVRVITLGASSTFGFYNRDSDTYPAQLERRLNATCGGRPTFEVLNMAIPHHQSQNIESVFFRDALKLSPDVVTFYEGRNDTLKIFDGGRFRTPQAFFDGAPSSRGPSLGERLQRTLLVARLVGSTLQAQPRYVESLDDI